MTDDGRVRAVQGVAETEASAADVQEQWIPVQEEPEDVPARVALPIEASEADVIEQLRAAPLDDDDWR